MYIGLEKYEYKHQGKIYHIECTSLHRAICAIEDKFNLSRANRRNLKQIPYCAVAPVAYSYVKFTEV